MYRRTQKYQQQVAYLAAAQADREQKQLEGANPVVQTNLPELRRIIEITDFDSGTPVTHRIELYRSDRIDCYNVNIDGQPWMQRMGWSRILAALRNALPRLRQFY
ncbi:hypothetical protein AYI82_05840 [Shewanella algae]|uniref:hypothetical protein n=1 Tax=Shewanella algae TaxID=38313 RepID=UPI001182D4A8|nr:hypothetical protein [Shewanella algae]TVL10541.1 hypothetical protein AYI82_05840 [Shewanella algae]